MTKKQKKYTVKNQKTITTKKKSAKKTSSKNEYIPPSEIRLQLMPYFLVLIAFFLVLCLFATSFTGVLGGIMKKFLVGLFSWGAFFIPVLLIARAFLYRKEATSRHALAPWVVSFLLVVIIAGICATASCDVEGYNPLKHYHSALDDKGMILTGSLFGGIVSNALKFLIGRIPHLYYTWSCSSHRSSFHSWENPS